MRFDKRNLMLCRSKKMLALTTLLLVSGIPVSAQPKGPRPGDVYREYTQYLLWPKEWRVTDPGTKQARGIRDYLPNPVMPLQIDDLDGATRAEVEINRWGGHAGTRNKRMRFNGNDWLRLPELTTTPAGNDPECYLSVDNFIMPVPLSHLHEGSNTFEGTAGNQEKCHIIGETGWGQWGWYGVILRVYYDSSKPHPEGHIAAPANNGTLGENPKISIEAQSDIGIARVDVLAHYEGYDENGDGIYHDWHYNYHYTSIGQHAGTATRDPFEVTWDTQWVPDQPAGSIQLIARIRDHNGTWFVTDLVGGLTLARKGASVKLYTADPAQIPTRFNVRAGQKKSVRWTIPPADNLSTAREAAVHLRTWDGHGETFKVNDWIGDIGGVPHDFLYSVRLVPPSVLRQGDNIVEFHSETEHHGPEILWPGPALTVRYSTAGDVGTPPF